MHNNLFGPYGTLPLSYTERLTLSSNSFVNFCQQMIPSRNMNIYIQNIHQVLFNFVSHQKPQNNTYKFFKVNNQFNTINISIVGWLILGENIIIETYENNMILDQIII